MFFPQAVSLLSCLLFIFLSMITGGCTPQKHVVKGIKQKNPFRAPTGLYAGYPISGLFIGVSNYKNEGIQFTPAHTLSAVAMHEPFFEALLNYKRYELEQREFVISKVPGIKSVAMADITMEGDHFVAVHQNGSASSWTCTGEVCQKICELKLKRRADAITHLHLLYDTHWAALSTRDDQVLIWNSKKDEDPIVIGQSDGEVNVLVTNQNRTHLVAGTKNGRLQIWELAQSKLVYSNKLNTKAITALAFENNDKFIAAGFEDGAVHIVDFSENGESKHLKGHTKVVTSVEFGFTGKLLTASADRTARVWTLDGDEKPVILDTGMLPLQRARFTPDGRFVITLASQGPIQIWSASGHVPPRTIGMHGEEVHYCDTHLDQEMVITGSHSFDHQANFVDLHSLYPFIKPIRLTRQAERALAVRYNRQGLQLLIERSAPKAEVEYWRIAGNHVLDKTYKDNSPYSHPWRSPKAVRLHLLADLRINRDDPLAVHLVMALAQMKGAQSELNSWNIPTGATHFHASVGPGRQSTTVYDTPGQDVTIFGNDKLVNKYEIFKYIYRAIANARIVERLHGKALILIYISAHGKIGSDGRPYFFPADADRNNETTWIAYDDVTSLIFSEFLARGDAAIAYRKLERQKRELLNNGASTTEIAEWLKHAHEQTLTIEEFVRRRQALIIFDTCQYLNDYGDATAFTPIFMPRGLRVFHSASPGQYAWHWPTGFKVATIETDKKSENQVFRGNMSFIPVASAIHFSLMADMPSEIPSQKPREIRKVPDELSVTYIDDWLLSMRMGVREFNQRLETAVASQNRQDARIYKRDEIIKDLPILIVSPEEAREKKDREWMFYFLSP